MTEQGESTKIELVNDRATWLDVAENECNLSMSTLARKAAIRFGAKGSGMLLDQEMVAQLWPFLKRFAETGGLE